MSLRDYLYEKKYKEVLAAESFEKFVQENPIFESYFKYPDSEIERDFKAIRARPDKSIYTAHGLRLPEVLTFEELFTSWEIVDEKNKNKGIFVSTLRCENIDDGWRDDGKFYHLRVIPSEQVRKVNYEVYGGILDAFEIVQRDDEFLVILKSRMPDSASGFQFSGYLAVIYNLPSNILKKG